MWILIAVITLASGQQNQMEMEYFKDEKASIKCKLAQAREDLNARLIERLATPKSDDVDVIFKCEKR